MKIAVSGKGGVGKTTFAAVLARLYAAEGRTVLCADADPDANLGLALGFTEEEIDDIVPVAQMNELIAERTGTTKENYGKFFKINPKVDDIPDRFAAEKNGVKLLVMGTVESGGSGCVCPENVMLKRVISNLVIARDEVVILDMEAGLEHLGRGTADFVDMFVVVIEPGARSVQTYKKIKRLAFDIGVRNINVVANKVRSDEDEAYLRERIPSEELLGVIHYNAEVIDADRLGISPYETSADTVREIREIKQRIDSMKGEN
ncbi:MAG: AAA family ATPase [Oscillospiraceae bacterium]|jgi:CO dehydrogenase maturation factor|nr:AAA family ATPase [Oscillospiraceae bacterium]